MKDLPSKIGALTLARKLGSSDNGETYEGYLAQEERTRVYVRRILPELLRVPAQRREVETRVRDLMGVRHPFLVPVLDLIEHGNELLMVEQWVEGLDLATAVGWCRTHGKGMPHNVFLNLSTQVCNGLEALHGRPGKVSGNPNVLHMGLCPGTLFVNTSGRVLLGGYALSRDPARLLAGSSSAGIRALSYFSPEQTQADQKLIPASDIFTLATVLYELLTLEPLFQGDSVEQTLHKLRRAEVTTQLLRIKELMQGLDKVLYRALSLSPRHRYQRAFVLREDLRGLMAGYSFASIADDTRAFLEPILASHPLPEPAPMPDSQELAAATGPQDEFDDKASTRIDPDPLSTAAYASNALAERVAREQASTTKPAPAPEPEPAPEPVPSPVSPATPSPASTGAYISQALAESQDPAAARPLSETPPTLAPIEEAAPAPAPVAPRPSSPPVATPPQQFPAPPKGAAPAQPAAPVPTPMPVAPQAAAPAAAPIPVAAPDPGAPLQQKQESTRPVPAPVSRSAALAAAAPPPGRSAAPAPAPPQAAPAPQPASPAAPPSDIAGAPVHPPMPPMNDDEDITGDWEPPRKTGRTMAMLMLGGLVLVLICSGALYAGWRYIGAAKVGLQEDLADLDIEVVAPELPPAPEVDLDGVAAAGEPDDADPEDPEASAAVAEDAEPAEETEPEAPSSARDRPAYEGPSSSTTSSKSPSSSSRGSSSSSRSSSRSSSSPSSSSRSSSSSSRSSSSSSRSSSSSSRSSSSSSSYSAPTSSSSSSSYERQPTSYSGDGLVELSMEEPGEDTQDDSSDLLDRYTDAASVGSLSSSDIMVIEMVQPEDVAYTRSRLMLVMNAKSKGDASGVKRYLDELSLRPENQYNPVVLSEYSRYYVNKGDYQRALDKAVLAERYWARLPPELVFTKKAEIYEVEAASYQGLFYRSEDNIDLLEKSLRHWEKYREHVMTKSRTDLLARAEREIQKLESIRERLQ